MQGQPELLAYPAQSASPERQSQREPSLPLEAPSWEKVSLDSGGGVYAGSQAHFFSATSLNLLPHYFHPAACVLGIFSQCMVIFHDDLRHAVTCTSECFFDFFSYEILIHM